MKINRRITDLIVFLMPFVLLSDMFFITQDLTKNILKICVFLLIIFLIPKKELFRKKIRYYIIYLLSLSVLFPTIIIRETIESAYAILYILPFSLLFIPASKVPKISKRQAIYTVILFFSILIFVTIMPKEIDNARTIFYILVSGPHTSTYSIIIIYYFIYIAYLEKCIGKNTFIVISIIMLYLVAGYRARNAELGLFFFVMTYAFNKSRFNHSSKYVILFVFSTFLILALYIFLSNSTLTTSDLNLISNGRIFAWSERLTMLQNTDIYSLLFGEGYGADFKVTKQWWWAEKPSHNDFLSIIFNAGLLGFSLLIILLLNLYKNANSFQRALIMFLIATSMTNTGLLGRPIQMLYFMYVYMLASKQGKS